MADGTSSFRNAVLIGTTFFGIERVVAYALRAKAAHDISMRQSVSLETYFQATLSDGFISIGQDLAVLTRALLVNVTLGPDMLPKDQSAARPRDAESDTEMPLAARSNGYRNAPKSTFMDHVGLEDHPRTRFWVRRGCGAATILFWVTVILSTLSGIDYQNAVKSGAHAALVRQLRYGSAVLALILLVGLATGAVWASFRLSRVPKRSVMWIVLVAALLSTVAIYRLDVMRFSTTSLFSDAPGSLNSSQSKVMFYIFHATPEFVSAAILMCLNVRRVFATGMWGDRRSTDPKPKM